MLALSYGEYLPTTMLFGCNKYVDKSEGKWTKGTQKKGGGDK